MQIQFSGDVEEWIDPYGIELSLYKNAPENIKKEFEETLKIINESYTKEV